MLKKFYLENDLDINEKSYLYECDNNTTILVVGDDEFSVKKEDLNAVKLLFELNNVPYEVIPKKIRKHFALLDKISKNNDVYYQEVYFGAEKPEYILYDANTRRPLTEKNKKHDYTETNFDYNNDDIKWYNEEIINAAYKMKFNLIKGRP